MLPMHESKKRWEFRLDQCSLNVIRDDEYKYVHFCALPPLFFDKNDDPNEFQNLAESPAHATRVLDYAGKLISWRMENDERTLTDLKLTSRGVVRRDQDGSQEAEKIQHQK